MAVLKLLPILFVWILPVESCDPPVNYTPPTLEENLHMASLVIYGRDLEHVVTLYTKTGWENITDSKFQVFCILRIG